MQSLRGWTLEIPPGDFPDPGTMSVGMSQRDLQEPPGRWRVGRWGQLGPPEDAAVSPGNRTQEQLPEPLPLHFLPESPTSGSQLQLGPGRARAGCTISAA